VPWRRCRPNWPNSKPKVPNLADQYLRAKAEAENARRRAEDESPRHGSFAVEAFAESLLPVADSLEAGLHHQGRQRSTRSAEGAQATLRQLIARAGTQQGGRHQPRPGARFDPHQHQAISVVPC